MAKVFDKIFDTSEEKFLEAVVVYPDSDGILYADSTASKRAVTKAELINLFKKSLLVVDNGTDFIRPTTLTVSTDYASVGYITVGTSSIAVLSSFYSEGYDAD